MSRIEFWPTSEGTHVVEIRPDRTVKQVGVLWDRGDEMTLYAAEMARRAACEQQQDEEHKPVVLTDEQVAAVDECSDQVGRSQE